MTKILKSILLISVLGCILTAPAYAASINTSTKVVGKCDAYFNNLASGPVQVVAVPGGTICTAKVVVTKGAKAVVSKIVKFQTVLASGSKVNKSKLTNSKGAAQFTFSIGAKDCFYVTSVKGVSAYDIITLFNSSTVNGCDQ